MSASVPPELDAMIGRKLGGKYRLLRVIGRGGTGTVFEAEHAAAGARFAVKLLAPEWAKDPAVAGRFAREGQAASSVASEHIVRVFEAGTDEGRPYIAMELLRGEDLGTRLRRESRVPQRDALHIAAQVLRGLAAAHLVGVVHRDLKPDNVLLVEHAGDASFAKIVDFGMSKMGKPLGGTAAMALTRRGVILGTPLYMAPEQARGLPDVDGRADLFSLGAIVFECLTGRPPHVGESYEQILLARCMQDSPDVRVYAPEVPPAVAAFVGRALARERAERFASAAEMLAALRVIAPGDPAVRPLPGEVGFVASAPPAGGGQPAAAGSEPIDVQQRARRGRARVAATAILATITGGAATVGALAMRRTAGVESAAAHAPGKPATPATRMAPSTVTVPAVPSSMRASSSAPSASSPVPASAARRALAPPGPKETPPAGVPGAGQGGRELR